MKIFDGVGELILGHQPPLEARLVNKLAAALAQARPNQRVVLSHFFKADFADWARTHHYWLIEVYVYIYVVLLSLQLVLVNFFRGWPPHKKKEKKEG